EARQEAARALEPATCDRGLAAKRDGVPREPDAHPGSTGSIAGLAVQAVRTLARLDGELPVVQPPRRHGEGLHPPGAPATLPCCREEGPSPLPPPPLHGLAARAQWIGALDSGLRSHGAHIAPCRMRSCMAPF